MMLVLCTLPAVARQQAKCVVTGMAEGKLHRVKELERKKKTGTWFHD